MRSGILNGAVQFNGLEPLLFQLFSFAFNGHIAVKKEVEKYSKFMETY
jgi:hypothetical protein